MAEQNHTYRKRVRVYYEHTDAGGVVYHANYLNFMERCRCDWLEDMGWGVVRMQEDTGIMWVVHEINIQYHNPARLFDDLDVRCRALQVGKVSLLVEQKIYNKELLLCTATLKLATLDATSFKLAAMPKQLKQLLAKGIE
jgi:acyl-CoA thioester hydrolase